MFCFVVTPVSLFLLPWDEHRKWFLLRSDMSGFLLVVFLFVSFSNAFNMQKVTSANWRLQIWRESIELIKKQPLLGYGVNMYMPQYQILRRSFAENGASKYGPTYAHNCFIQICFETGLLGLTAFILIIGRILYLAAVNFQRVGSVDGKTFFLSLGLFSSFITMLVHSFFDNHLYSLQLSAFFWVIAGLIMAVHLNLLKKGEARHA
jgi:O-antigen ligase